MRNIRYVIKKYIIKCLFFGMSLGRKAGKGELLLGWNCTIVIPGCQCGC